MSSDIEHAEATLNALSSVSRINFDDDHGIRGMTAWLTCGHIETADSEMGGFDEMPYGTPSFSLLAGLLAGKVTRHDCDRADQTEARRKAWQAEVQAAQLKGMGIVDPDRPF